jgi:hypothetical protein
MPTLGRSRGLRKTHSPVPYLRCSLWLLHGTSFNKGSLLYYWSLCSHTSPFTQYYNDPVRLCSA